MVYTQELSSMVASELKLVAVESVQPEISTISNVQDPSSSVASTL